MKEKSRQEKQARLLKNLGKMYEKATLETRRQLIALILLEKAVLEVGSFDQTLSPAAKVVFGRNWEVVGTEPMLANTAEEDLYFQMIWEAERKKGRGVSPEMVRHIPVFLRKLSKLLIFRE